jgi:hypothetical protein
MDSQNCRWVKKKKKEAWKKEIKQRRDGNGKDLGGGGGQIN